MTKSKLFGAAAAILSSALASPVMAQEVIYNPGYCAQFYPNANCQNKGPGNPYTGSYQRRIVDRTYWDSNASWNDRWDRRYDSGSFWPADVAAGVVGGAVGTAAAVATAPFRTAAYAYDSYAYYGGDPYVYYNNGYRGSYAYYNNGYRGGPKQSYPVSRQSYAASNGFVCEPGSRFKGEDGLMYVCQ
ncbi:MAG TPA: hypothetical protein VGJ68_12825 [Bradyrhizobium sp.]|jgi:hypothetical protein